MEAKTFEHKFVRLSPTLYRVAYSLLRNEQDAEDAVQDTLVALWRDVMPLAILDALPITHPCTSFHLFATPPTTLTIIKVC